MSLFTNCMERKSTECLYITCVYLLNNDTDKLEDEWINISSNIGKSKNLVFGKLWCSVNNDLYNLIMCEKYNVQEALIMTSKLYLLNSRIVATNPSSSVLKIRKEIIEYFPDTAALAYDGIKMYRQILPSPQNENYIFYSRILACFSRLFESHIDKLEDKEEAIRNALEYITRKKNDMQLPGTWPIDTINDKSYGSSDPIWFLWGMFLSYFHDEKIAINFEIYKYNFRKNSRMDRVGLLWGLSYSLKNNLSFTWTTEEQNILIQVKNMAPELWKNIKEELEVKKEIKKEELQNRFVLDTFLPRSSSYNNDNNIKSQKEKIQKQFTSKIFDVSKKLS